MLKFLAKIEDFFCASALLLTAILLFVNVVLRYVFSASTSWAEELIRYLMIWITFIGGSVCVRKGAHIRMDFLLTLLPKGSHLWLNRLVFIGAALFCGALFWYSLQLVLFTIELEQTSPAMKLPMWIPYLAMPVGSGLMAFRFAQMALRKEECAQ